MNYENPSQKKIVDGVALNLAKAGCEDTDWDETDVVETSYKELGLKRYKLDIKMLGKHIETDETKETVCSSKDVKDGSEAVQTLQDGFAVTIKVECQEVLALMAIRAVLKSG